MIRVNIYFLNLFLSNFDSLTVFKEKVFESIFLKVKVKDHTATFKSVFFC